MKHIFRCQTPAKLYVLIIFFVLPLTAEAKEEIVLGLESAPVTLVEYGSLTCDYCIHFHREVLPHVKSRYIDTGLVRFIFRDFPTSKKAHRGAVAARCSGDRYYETLHALFIEVGKWTQADDVDLALIDLAVPIESEKKSFKQCINDSAQQAAVTEAQQGARAELGITGTPTFLINDKLVQGKKTIEQMEKLLNAALPVPR